jgi:hypothetical protein
MCHSLGVRETYEIETIVQRPATPRLEGALAVASVVCVGLVVAGIAFSLWLCALAVMPLVCMAWLTMSLRAVRARVAASREGLRVGARLTPRRRLDSAFLKHEGDRTYVALRGWAEIDVDVPNNIEADALVRALGLDAASSTIEFTLGRSLSPKMWAFEGVLAVLVVVGFGYGSIVWPLAPVLGACGAALVLAIGWVATRVFLRIGADGLVLRHAVGKRQFISHDALAAVHADDDRVVLEAASGDAIVLRVPGLPHGNADDQRDQRERRADEAAAVVRRIQQARRAFRENRVDPSTLAGLLDRGQRSTREWLEHLRRLGDGAASTFRTMGATRAQLLGLVESTTASARDRVAAVVALRAALTDEETTRLRVAAERCAEPELRQRLVDVAEAEEDLTLAAALEASEPK